MKAIFRILALTVVATLFAGSTLADTSFIIYGQSYLDLSYSSSKTMTASGSTYTYSFTATATGSNQSFKIYKNSLSDDNALCCQTQALQFGSTYDCVVKKSDTSYKNELNMSVTQGVKYAITVVYTDDNNCKISIAQTSTTLTVNAVANPTAGGTCDKASGQCIEGGSVVFTVTPNDGYSYSSYSFDGVTSSSSVVKSGNTYTVSPTADGKTLTVNFAAQTFNVATSLGTGGASVSPTSQSGIVYDGSQTFEVTASDGYVLDKSGNTYYTGKADLSYDGNDITLSNIQSSGTLNIAFTANKTPIVYWAQYPTMGVNVVNLYGYLAERYCQEVKSAGFYWKLTNDITDEEVVSAVGGGTVSGHIIASDVTTPSSLVNGSAFNALDKVLTGIDDNTTIYLVNYVETCNGSGTDIGVSDRVALAYAPCKGLQSITLTPAEASIAAGYETEFSVVARGAGKSPVYNWYLDQTDAAISGGTATAIEGANSDTYTYTMGSPAASHTLKVKVTDSNCGTSQFTHDSPVVDGITATKKVDITPCETPSFDIAADKNTTTPWVARTLSVTNAANYYSADWCVEPNTAELTYLTKGGAVFRAPVNSGTSTTYTVTYTAKGACGNSTVIVTKTVDIKVQKDTEDCSE